MLNLEYPELKFAIETVRRASLLVRQVQSEMASQTLTKGDKSPVTVADFASQALVGRMLADVFPADPLVAEEAASALRHPDARPILEKVTAYVARFWPGAMPDQVCQWIDRGGASVAERFWTLDPIDGTKGFLRGDQYAIALALVVDGKVQVGILGCPNLVDGHLLQPGGAGSLVVAVRGQGAWTTSLEAPAQFSRLVVSDRHDPIQMRVLRSYESGHTNATQVDQMVTMLNVSAKPVLMDSQAKYAVLAAGAGDLSIRLLSSDKPDYREKIWDQAAGSLIVEEAGGRITDLDGAELDFTAGRSLTRNRGVVASNGRLHTAVLTSLKELGA
ncbi:MAG: 3'(2'),5'-bisphosphate nucleotidase [Anaerolineales bacterium]|nr:3'(2'),5'-bisphosphate nucleotidase [Anaerolineales bacterium]